MTEGTFTSEELRDRAIRVRKQITWFMLIAIVMFFAGLTSAYVVSMSGGYWVDIDVPGPFWISTAAIVLSSVFAQWALGAAAKGRTRGQATFDHVLLDAIEDAPEVVLGIVDPPAGQHLRRGHARLQRVRVP